MGEQEIDKMAVLRALIIGSALAVLLYQAYEMDPSRGKTQAAQAIGPTQLRAPAQQQTSPRRGRDD